MENRTKLWRSIFLVGLASTTAQGQVNFEGTRIVDRGEIPEWHIEPAFKHDVFTFIRIKYSVSGNYRRGRGSRRWSVDYPDAELNLCYRLQQMTSMKVDPDGKVLEITDKELFNYPFIYIVEPGDLLFDEDEVATLRRYLLSGGFLMVDDFWGDYEWMNFYRQIKRVFPNREPEELPLDHPIFHCVFDLKEKPQIPSIGQAMWGRAQGRTWERPDAQEVHFKGIFDDRRRMMVIVCHNTDLGDGWERESEDEWYFREFSEKKAYPLGINIIFYALTH